MDKITSLRYKYDIRFYEINFNFAWSASSGCERLANYHWDLQSKNYIPLMQRAILHSLINCGHHDYYGELETESPVLDNLSNRRGLPRALLGQRSKVDMCVACVERGGKNLHYRGEKWVSGLRHYYRALVGNCSNGWRRGHCRCRKQHCCNSAPIGYPKCRRVRLSTNGWSAISRPFLHSHRWRRHWNSSRHGCFMAPSNALRCKVFMASTMVILWAGGIGWVPAFSTMSMSKTTAGPPKFVP